jgi:hypothetical protein
VGYSVGDETAMGGRSCEMRTDVQRPPV